MAKVSRGDHDPEDTARKGMSTEGAEVDEAETMASSADLDEGDLEFFEENEPED